MNNISDRVAYLKGLVEGLNVDREKPEGRILDKVLDLLDAMSEEMGALRHDLEELDEYVQSIDEDLGTVEETLFDDEDECDGECSCCHHGDEDDEYCDDEDDEDDEEDGVVEYTCPYCGEEMTFEVENIDLDEDYLCPNCHKPLFPENEENE